MQNEWLTLLEKIRRKENKNPSWKSDQQSLEKIILWAMDNNIDPSGVSSIDNTKLRTIIKEAKRAINWGQPDQLAELFSRAQKLSVLDLRQSVGISKAEDIFVKRSTENDETKLIVEFSPEQFEKLIASTKAHFHYVFPDDSKYRKVL